MNRLVVFSTSGTTTTLKALTTLFVVMVYSARSTLIVIFCNCLALRQFKWQHRLNRSLTMHCRLPSSPVEDMFASLDRSLSLSLSHLSFSRA